MKTGNFETLNSIAKKITLLFSLIMVSMTGISQEINVKEVKISGKVNDEKTGKGVEAATVSAISIVPNLNGQHDTLSTLSMTGKDGSFTIAVTSVRNIRLIFSAVGFETKEKKIPIEAGLKEVNAGTFSLINEAKSLANVVVTAKKPLMTLAVDRRIFNADAAITSKGGNAVDVMKNIPSLTVDINGGVQLRNSTPQIFVDGRPTILTLEQIPAEDIDKVEVITNPSARYDAGSTGGIINIILKKNRKPGLNGVATLGFGSPQLFNSSLSLNYRKGKFNVFASGNYNKSGGVANGNAKRQNKSDGIITDYFNQESENDRSRRFSSFRFGADYFINKFNTISVTQGIVDGKFGNNETQHQIYSDNNAVLTKTGYRFSTDDDFFKRYNTQVNYRRSYDKSGKEWTADFTYSGGNNGGDGTIYNQLYSPDGQPSGTASTVNNFSTGTGDQFTIQTDYVNPISEKSKLELGARSYHNISKDKYDVYSVENGQSTKLPLSNNYSFREMVNAAYVNYSNAIGKLKYQGGLRIEQSSFDGNLIDSAQKFGYDYPAKGTDLWNSLFPSLYLTYELSDGNDLQANFSRRIQRPNFWQINPYVDISDPMNIRKGNPSLQPEFTNSFELNYNRTYSTGNILISTYYRNNTADITLYSDTISNTELEQMNNAAIDPNAILTTFINADRTNRTGVEITWQQRIGSSFDLTPNFNAQYRDVKAQVNDINLSNSGFNWNAKLMANYRIKSQSNKFANRFSFQLSGEYQSSRVLPQGKEKEQYSMDFAIRKDLLKNNAGTITFNINDVLNSRRFGSITDTENFYQDSYRRWNVRSFRLTFSYRFGKNDFEFFKRREAGGEDGNG